MSESRNWKYEFKIIKVVDADTFDVKINLFTGFPKDIGFHTHLEPLWRQERIRLVYADGSRFDAYETTLRGGTTPAEKVLGIEAKNLVIDLFKIYKSEGHIWRVKTLRPLHRLKSRKTSFLIFLLIFFMGIHILWKLCKQLTKKLVCLVVER